MVTRSEGLERDQAATRPTDNTSTQHVAPEMASMAPGNSGSLLRQPPGISNMHGSPVGLGPAAVAQPATCHAEFAVQDPKPREVGSAKLVPFSTPGAGFEQW